MAATARSLPDDPLLAAPAMVLVLGPEGTVEAASHRLEEALGLGPGALAGWPLASLLADPDAAATALAGGPVRLRRADGAPLDVVVEAARCGGGRVVGVATPHGAAADLSHALRTPLNAILGYAQLLRMADLDPRERRHAEAILAAGESLMAILGRALDGEAAGEGRDAPEG